MEDYSSKKRQKEKIHRRMQNKQNLVYGELIRKEENNKFLEKYWKLNEKLKDEDQY